MLLLTVDREGTGINRMLNPEDPRRFEAVVHADNVQLGRKVRRQIDAQVVRQIHHLVGARGLHLIQHVVELGDVATHDLHLIAIGRKIGGMRVDVHANHGLALRYEQRDDAGADKAGAPDNKYGHVCFLRCWRIRSRRSRFGARGTKKGRDCSRPFHNEYETFSYASASSSSAGRACTGPLSKPLAPGSRSTNSMTAMSAASP